MEPYDPKTDTAGGIQYRGLTDFDAALRQALASGLVPHLAGQVQDCLEQTASRWELTDTWSGDGGSQYWARELRGTIGEFVTEFETVIREDLIVAGYPPEYSFSGVGFARGHDELRILGDYESTRRELRYELEQALRGRDQMAYASLQRAALREHRFQFPNWAPWTPLHWFERLIEVAERRWGRETPTLELMRSFVHCMARDRSSLLVQTAKLLEIHGILVPAEDDASIDALAGASSAVHEDGMDDTCWMGLEELASPLRMALSLPVVYGVVRHLELCLRELLSEWSHRETRPSEDDPRHWAVRLEDRLGVILQQVERILHKDIEEAGYPPSYSFSGVGFAVNSTGLQVLGDYASTRRSLRHELEAALRGNHRQAYTELRRAALHQDRFRYPNWAPWSPLHWFERLMEASEAEFGQSAQTLDLMQAYVRCLDIKGDVLVAQTLDVVKACGLLEGAEEDLEHIDGPERAEHGRGQTWADYAPEQEDQGSSTEADEPASPGAQDPVSIAMPTDPGDMDQWTRWMTHTAARLLGDSASTAYEAQPIPVLWYGEGGDTTGVGPAGAAGPSRGRGGVGESPSREGTTGSDEPETADFGSRHETSFGSGTIRGDNSLPEHASAATRASVQPIARKLVRGVLDHIFEQLEFHPAVMTALDRAVPVLGDAVSNDLAFLTSRRHPLRLWLGELVNTGLHLDPDHADIEGGIAGQYLRCIHETLDAVQSAASELDEARDTRILEDWHAALAHLQSDWERTFDAQLAPMLELERLARAWRSLTACALTADTTLPRIAAETIVTAWAEVLSKEAEIPRAVLGDRFRVIVQAICEQVKPSSVNPLVQSFVNSARETGMPAAQLRACVEGLAEAHRQSLKWRSGESVFDPRTRVRERTPIRARDDDPDLLVDRADTRVFEASRLRVGDWFEFTDKSTGRPRRLSLVWHGEASRSFLFISLDGVSTRKHSLQGVAHELREDRLKRLPQDNPLDAILR